MRKFKKIEKMIIATGGDNYKTYDCETHGVFQRREDDDNGKCPYTSCLSNVHKIENSDELKSKFRLELGL